MTTFYPAKPWRWYHANFLYIPHHRTGWASLKLQMILLLVIISVIIWLELVIGGYCRREHNIQRFSNDGTRARWHSQLYRSKCWPRNNKCSWWSRSVKTSRNLQGMNNRGVYFYSGNIYFPYNFSVCLISFNVISEQGEKEKSMSCSVWDCSSGNYHRNNSLGCQKVDRHENWWCDKTTLLE